MTARDGAERDAARGAAQRLAAPGAEERLAALGSEGPDELGREIAGGPDAVEATLAEVARTRHELDPLIDEASRIVLLGTGMSLAAAHAAAPAWRKALAARHVSPAGHRAGVSPVLVRQSASAVFGSDGERWDAGDLVVAISKSGESPETVAAARRSAATGCTILAVTAEPASPLAGLAALTIPTPIGQERSAGTKSGAAALAALLAVPGALGDDAASRSECAGLLRAVIAAWPRAAAPGTRLAAAARTWIVGFGASAGLAAAAAILWHEKVRRQATALSVSEFRHGPIEAARPGDAVIVVDTDVPAPDRGAYLERLRAELAELGVRAVWLSPEPPDGVEPIRLAAPGGELAALEALVWLQQLARATAHAAGTYEDGFRVLRKVVRPAELA